LKSNFYVPESKQAEKIIGNITVTATWNNNCELTIQQYDKNGIYIPYNTFQDKFTSNSAMFEWLEKKGFIFIY